MMRALHSLSFALVLACGSGEAAVPEPSAHAERSAHEAHEASQHVHSTDELAAAEIDPGTSLFQIESTFSDQDGHAVTLSSFRGHPTVVVMFYGSCTTVCPLLIADARRIEHALSDEDRARTRFALVTIDPEVDTEEQLRGLAARHELDPARWSLLRGDAESVRELAMVLGVRYRRLSNGTYAHSALLTLLDPQGRIAARIEGITQPVHPIADAIAAFPRS